MGEVEKAIDTIYETGNRQVTLMHCTTDYPTDIKNVNMNAMITLKNAFHVPIGYSDHTLGFEAAVAAVVMGAVVIEKHITLDRDLPGPDHRASMPPEEFCEYVKHIRNAELLLGDGRKKPSEHEKDIMNQVRRSILANKDLKKGTILSKEMFCYKRPGDGIRPEYADILTGRELKRDIGEDEKIMWEDI